MVGWQTKQYTYVVLVAKHPQEPLHENTWNMLLWWWWRC